MRIRSSEWMKFSGVALAVTTAVLLAAGGASAEDRKLTDQTVAASANLSSNNPGNVAAHLSFAGLAEVDMAMAKKVKNKYYLYVQHSKDQGISIIDVSRAGEPKAVGAIPWPNPEASSRIDIAGDVALIAENDVFSAVSHFTQQDLVLWDLSNPASPHVLQTFSGVVKWLQDDRNFIYVLNADGLWVISKGKHRLHQAKTTERPEQVEDPSIYGG